MSAMFRRLLRISCVVGLVVIVGMAVVGQFADCTLFAPKGYIEVHAIGVQIAISADSYYFWDGMYRPPENSWSLQANLWWPSSFSEHMMGIPKGALLRVLNLPWWLLLLTWGVLTALVWRLTHRRKIGQGFPVEPTVKLQ